MKRITTLFILVLMATFSFANEIDNLNTIEEVQRFLIKKVDKKWKDYPIVDNTIKDTSTYGKGKFFKVDLDGNGLTDLVINGKYFLAITDKGNGKYNTHSIDKGTFALAKYTLTNILYSGKTPLLVIKANSPHFPDSSRKIDTIVLKSGYFIEYNPTPDNLAIEEVRFETSGCYGTCPVFTMAINNNKSATYTATRFNDVTGDFKATIDNDAYKQLIETINYIQLQSLKDNYEVGWTDDQTVTLLVKFNNGQVKSIRDYGAIGSFGLESVYNQLFALRKSQQWK